jgi:hypothetical protein
MSHAFASVAAVYSVRIVSVPSEPRGNVLVF